MKRYSAAEARRRFSDLLTAAEAGEQVVIERRGVQYTLVARATESAARRRNLVARMDPAVESGQFTWETGPEGLGFTPRDPAP